MGDGSITDNLHSTLLGVGTVVLGGGFVFRQTACVLKQIMDGSRLSSVPYASDVDAAQAMVWRSALIFHFGSHSQGQIDALPFLLPSVSFFFLVCIPAARIGGGWTMDSSLGWLVNCRIRASGFCELNTWVGADRQASSGCKHSSWNRRLSWLHGQDARTYHIGPFVGPLP